MQAFGDLTGSTVECTNGKNIAIFGGIAQGIISTTATSHMYEQVLPNSLWGTDFIYVPNDSLNYDELKFLASENGTEIFADSVSLVILNSNGHLTRMFSTPTFIHANKLITVSKICKGGQNSMSSYSGDPNLVSLLPLDIVQYKVKVQLRAISSLQSNYMNILIHTLNIGDILFDSQHIDTYFHPVPFLSCYSYAQFRIDTTFHVLESNSGFNTTIETFEYFDAYTFNGGFSDRVFLDAGLCGVPISLPDFKITNIITPNGDGLNDIWIVKDVFISYCAIYNRWGEIVFSVENSDCSWDGTYKKTNNKVTNGIYYYILKVRLINEEIKTVKGFIEVLY